MIEPTQGIKNIQVVATTHYPVVSAYEYEFLKGEDAVQERMQGCTIYFIMQRPLLFFDNVVPMQGEIAFDITDGVQPPLHCRLEARQTAVLR
jgi:hypothetical protein